MASREKQISFVLLVAVYVALGSLGAVGVNGAPTGATCKGKGCKPSDGSIQDMESQLFATLNSLRKQAGAARVCNSSELSTKAAEWIANVVASGLHSCANDTSPQTKAAPHACFTPPILPHVSKSYTDLAFYISRMERPPAPPDALQTLSLFNDMSSGVNTRTLWNVDFTDAGVVEDGTWVALMMGRIEGGGGGGGGGGVDFCVPLYGSVSEARGRATLNAYWAKEL